MREGVSLKCSKCRRENYRTTINKKKQTKALERAKFCFMCRARTVHKQKS